LAEGDEYDGEDLPESLAEQLRGTFIHDLDVARERLRSPGEEFDRKSFVRAVFAYIEGLTSARKDIALRYASVNGGPVEWSRAELALALEEKYELTNSGEAKERSRQPPRGTAQNVLFGFRLAARVARRNWKPDLNSPGYKNFDLALEIRNRITHPPTIPDSRVTQEDVDIVQRGLEWFEEQTRLIGPARWSPHD
jgi:hypothetical protein